VHDDALKFCPKDGTPLVDGSGAAVGEGAGTLKFTPSQGADTTETRILPTGEGLGRPTAPTTVLDAQRASAGTRELSRPKSRRGVVIAAVIVSLALAASAYIYLSRGRSVSAKNSIAVLPFANASQDPDMEYLSDGISESLINSLSQLPNVRVMASSTMFSFKGKALSPQAVGRQLGVDAVLTGRVIQAGDNLSVQAELVNAEDGTQMWGERYSRRMTDVLAVQDEIVRDVSQKLRARLSGAGQQGTARSYTSKPEAYQLYLKGRFYWNKRSLRDTETAVRYFQQAIAADPSFAHPFSGLADSYVNMALFDSGPPAHEVMPKARDAALKAIALDERSSEAHAALGFVLFLYDFDFTGSEREFKRATELNPSYETAHQRYSFLLTALGRHEESLAEMRRALEIDPLSLMVNRSYGDRLIDARKYDEAVTQLNKTLELDGNFALPHSSLASVYQMRGDYAASVEEIAKAYELTGRLEYATLARESFAKGGWQGYLRAMLERRPDLRAYTRATYYAALGEKDEAFAELDKAYENREAGLTRLKVDKRLDPLRSDPRFADLMRRVGLPQ
jgi:TolB-like protein/Tfp pilus assembly protein PilF